MSVKSASIEGLDELIKAFADLGEEAIPYLKESVAEAGQIVLSKSKQKAPVKTGKLRDGLKLSKPRRSSKYPYKVLSNVTLGKGTAYGVPLELGHGTVKARPFLRPAADESKDEVIEKTINGMNNALENMGGNK